MAIMVKGTRAASDAPFKWPTRSLKALTSLSFFTRHTDKIYKKFTVIFVLLRFQKLELPHDNPVFQLPLEFQFRNPQI